MMKFFRKYTKHLLVIFMSLLLIVWLGSDALMNLLTPTDDTGETPRGKAFGQEVRLKDLWAARNEGEILSALLGIWRMPWVYTLVQLGVTDPNTWQEYAWRTRQEPLTDEEWYMLSVEARKHGAHVPAEALERFKQDNRITAASIEALRNRRRISLDDIDRALQSFLQVQERVFLACRTPQISEADIQQFIREAFERARVTIVAVDEAPFLDGPYEPTTEEITAQFEKYKNTASPPAGGLDFGYQLPEAVEVEYIKVNAGALLERQPVSDTDQATFDYWQAHKNEFTKPSTQPAEPDDPTKPPKREEPVPYGTFTEAKHAVVANLKRREAEKQAMEIARDLIVELGKAWADAPTTRPGNYREPPDTEKSEDVYPRLVERYQRRYPQELLFSLDPTLEKDLAGGVISKELQEAFEGQDAPLSPRAAVSPEEGADQWLIQDPGQRYVVARQGDSLKVYRRVIEHGRTDLLDQPSLFRDPEIGQTRARAGTNQQAALVQAAFWVAGLEAKPDDRPNSMLYFRNVYETCAVPFVDQAGNAYVFRTMAARPREAPASMESVGERIIADLRLQRAHEETHKRAVALMERAGQAGLEAAFRSDEDLFKLLGEKALSAPPPFTRKRVGSRPGTPTRIAPGSVTGFWGDSELVDACFSLAGKTATQPVHVLVHEQRRPPRWLVVQLNRIEPVTQAEYDQQRATAIDYCRTQRQLEVLANWFAPDQIPARIAWEDAFTPAQKRDKDKPADKQAG